MEDLGWYLANYSAAECMLWGYKQVNSITIISIRTGNPASVVDIMRVGVNPLWGYTQVHD